MENIFTIKQVALILKVHQLTVRRYIREKKLAAVRFAGGVRIKESDLMKFQKDYVTRSTKTPLPKDLPKIFSLNDPIFQLEGKGGSLALPQNEGR